MREFGGGPIPDPKVGEESQKARAALRESAKNKPVEEMTDEEVSAVFKPQGFDWDVMPNPNNDPNIAAHNKNARKIRERLDEINRKQIQN